MLWHRFRFGPRGVCQAGRIEERYSAVNNIEVDSMSNPTYDHEMKRLAFYDAPR